MSSNTPRPFKPPPKLTTMQQQGAAAGAPAVSRPANGGSIRDNPFLAADRGKATPATAPPSNTSGGLRNNPFLQADRQSQSSPAAAPRPANAPTHNPPTAQTKKLATTHAANPVTAIPAPRALVSSSSVPVTPTPAPVSSGVTGTGTGTGPSAPLHAITARMTLTARSCHACQQDITEQSYVSAAGRYYHTRHFVCCQCNRALATGQFQTVQDRLVCTPCASTLKPCYVCCHSILPLGGEQAASIDDSTFVHMRCFSCSVCATSLANVPMHADRTEQKLYCEPHAREKLATPIHTCCACGDAIRGRVLLALDSAWHPSCFQCVHCLMSLENKPFTLHEDSVYCERDYRQLFLPKCHECNKCIDGPSISIENVSDRTFHPGCLKCASCRVALSANNFFQPPSDPRLILCRQDYDRLFCQSCPVCRLALTVGGPILKVGGKSIHQSCFTCATCAEPLTHTPYEEVSGKFLCEEHATKQHKHTNATNPAATPTPPTRPPPQYKPSGTHTQATSRTDAPAPASSTAFRTPASASAPAPAVVPASISPLPATVAAAPVNSVQARIRALQQQANATTATTTATQAPTRPLPTPTNKPNTNTNLNHNDANQITSTPHHPPPTVQSPILLTPAASPSPPPAATLAQSVTVDHTTSVVVTGPAQPPPPSSAVHTADLDSDDDEVPPPPPATTPTPHGKTQITAPAHNTSVGLISEPDDDSGIVSELLTTPTVSADVSAPVDSVGTDSPSSVVVSESVSPPVSNVVPTLPIPSIASSSVASPPAALIATETVVVGGRKKLLPDAEINPFESPVHKRTSHHTSSQLNDGTGGVVVKISPSKHAPALADVHSSPPSTSASAPHSSMPQSASSPSFTASRHVGVSAIEPEPPIILHDGAIPPAQLPPFIAKGVEAALADAAIETRAATGATVQMGTDYAKKEMFNLLHAGISYQFQDYAPQCFASIRAHYGISHDSYVQSLVGGGVTGGALGDGKSGMLFYASTDGRYVLKTLKREELKFFRKILHSYLAHLFQHPHTLLPRFLGMYKLSYTLKGGKSHTYRLVVMNNLFDVPPGIAIEQRFDLKGSTRNRKIPPHLIKPGRVLLDLNFAEQGLKIRVGQQQKLLLLEQIRQDCIFLKAANIMDHSLLVGIHYDPPDSDPDSTLPIAGHSLLEPLLPDSDSASGSLMSIWESTRGGIRGFTPNGAQTRREIYYLGIIDILCQFDTKKALESAYKVIRFNKNAVSAIESRGYNERFMLYLESVME